MRLIEVADTKTAKKIKMEFTKFNISKEYRELLDKLLFVMKRL